LNIAASTVGGRNSQTRSTGERRRAGPLLDEVDIHLNPKIGGDWMLAGQQRRILTPGKNQKF